MDKWVKIAVIFPLFSSIFFFISFRPSLFLVVHGIHFVFLSSSADISIMIVSHKWFVAFCGPFLNSAKPWTVSRTKPIQGENTVFFFSRQNHNANRRTTHCIKYCCTMLCARQMSSFRSEIQTFSAHRTAIPLREGERGDKNLIEYYLMQGRVLARTDIMKSGRRRVI